MVLLLRVHKMDPFSRLHISLGYTFLQVTPILEGPHCMLPLKVPHFGPVIKGTMLLLFLDPTCGPKSLDFTCMGPTQKIHCLHPGFWLQKVAPNNGLLGCIQGQRMTEGFLSLNSRLSWFHFTIFTSFFCCSSYCFSV